MASFVLISGSWHAGWCWERVVPLLEAAGHRALAPDLIGTGQDPRPFPAAPLEGWADQIAALIEAQAEPVVLVGHSRGGLVISEVAERVPEHIAQLVYLTALLLPAGGPVGEALGVPAADLAAAIVPQADGTTLVKADLIGELFYNRTAPEWTARAVDQVGPEPGTIFAAVLTQSDDRYGRIPRAYVECAHDKALTLDFQRAMQARLPCDPVITLEADHSPFFSMPDQLAATLITIAAGGHRGDIDR